MSRRKVSPPRSDTLAITSFPPVKVSALPPSDAEFARVVAYQKQGMLDLAERIERAGSIDAEDLAFVVALLRMVASLPKQTISSRR